MSLRSAVSAGRDWRLSVRTDGQPRLDSYCVRAVGDSFGSFRRHPFRILVVGAASIVVLLVCRISSAQDAGRATLSLDQLVDGMRQFEQRWLNHNGLVVEYDTTVQNFDAGSRRSLTPHSRRLNAWKGDWYYSHSTTPKTDVLEAMEHWVLWKDGIQVERHGAGATIRDWKGMWAVSGASYTNGLWLNTHKGPEPPVLDPIKAELPSLVPWLPVAVAENRRKYRVLDRLEIVDGSACHVLERPGMDRIWIDAAHGFLPRRRIVHWSENGPLRDDIENLALFQPVPGVWAPKRQIHKRYSFPSDPARDLNKVSSQLTRELRRLEFNTVTDAFFTVPFPPRVFVMDEVRKVDYVTQPDTPDPWEQAIETVRTQAITRRGVSRHRWFLLINGILLGLAVMVVLWRLSQRTARSP